MRRSIILFILFVFLLLVYANMVNSNRFHEKNEVWRKNDNVINHIVTKKEVNGNHQQIDSLNIKLPSKKQNNSE